MKAHLLKLFTFLVLLGLSTQTFAENPTITSTLGSALKVNVPYNFTVSTTAGDAEGTSVRIKLQLENPSQRSSIRVSQLQEDETYQVQTIAEDGSVYYANGAAFPLHDVAMDHFRIEFSAVGNYKYTLSIINAANAEVLASKTMEHQVDVFREPTINSTLDVISESADAGVRAGSQTIFGIYVTAGDRAEEVVTKKLVLENPAQRNNIRIEVATNEALTEFQEMTFTDGGVLYLGAEDGAALATEEKFYRIRFSEAGTYIYTLKVERGLDVLTQTRETVVVQEGNATIATSLNNKAGVKAGVEQNFTLTYGPGTWPAATDVRIKLTLLSLAQQENLSVQYEATEGSYVDVTANEQGIAYLGTGAHMALGTGGTINMKATALQPGTYSYRVELMRRIPNQVDEVIASSTEQLVVTFVNATIASTLHNKENVLKNTDTEFTVTVRQNDVPANTMVRARITVAPAQASNINLMYRESATQPYTTVEIDNQGVGYFGNAAGFQLADATGEFKVRFAEPGTYNYKLEIVQVSNGTVLATANESVEVNNTMSIGNSLAKNTVAVYPTVSNGNVTVDLGDLNQAQVQVLDVLGRTVTTLENTGAKAQINTAQFAKGTYFVRVLKDNKTATGRFIVR